MGFLSSAAAASKGFIVIAGLGAVPLAIGPQNEVRDACKSIFEKAVHSVSGLNDRPQNHLKSGIESVDMNTVPVASVAVSL